MSAQHFALHVPNSPYSLCGRKATLNHNTFPLHVPNTSNSPYGLCGRKATLNSNTFPSFSLNGGADVDGVAMSTEQAEVASASTPKGVLVTQSNATAPVCPAVHRTRDESTGHRLPSPGVSNTPA